MQEEALETIHRQGARLVSLTPLRATLEDYFIERVGRVEKVEVGR
jgi:hypothetical protein